MSNLPSDVTNIQGMRRGQLEALLALGYCHKFGKPIISAQLLRPWARAVTPPIWRTPYRTDRLAELDERFEYWVDMLRGRIKRMRRKLGSNEVDARADVAFDRVDVFLRNF